MRDATPLGALARGMAAGALGALAQNWFFKASARIAPETPKDVFEPAEEQQKSEMAVETIARRFAEGLMRRGPLSQSAKQAGGEVVHFAFGAGWGGLWGLARETYPQLNRPLGVAAFSALVWTAGDHLLEPAFKLAAWPQAYPLKTHAYAFAAHLVYGLGVWASYEATRGPLGSLLGAGLWALGARRAAHKALPKAVRPAADRFIDAAAMLRAKRPLGRAAGLLGA